MASLESNQDEVDGGMAGIEDLDVANTEASKELSSSEPAEQNLDAGERDESLYPQGDWHHSINNEQSAASASMTKVDSSGDRTSGGALCDDERYVEESVQNKLGADAVRLSAPFDLESNSSRCQTAEGSNVDDGPKRDIGVVKETADDGKSCDNVDSVTETAHDVGEETAGESSKSSDVIDSVEETSIGSQQHNERFEGENSDSHDVGEETTESSKSSDVYYSVEETSNGSQPSDEQIVEKTRDHKSDDNNSDSVSNLCTCDSTSQSTPNSSQYLSPLSNSEPFDPETLSTISLDFERPRDQVIKLVLPNTKQCPVYALVLCAWSNILGPHAQYVWGTEGKHHFTSDMLAYLSTHTLTSSDQPQNTVDTKMLILKVCIAFVSIFLFFTHHFA